MSFPKAEIKQTGAVRTLYVMAAEAEYGPHLKSRCAPLMTGVGPVEAGVALGAMLGALAARDELPDFVVALGSAGSASLEQTMVYQASSLSYRDMDASPIGFEKGRTPFLDLPIEVTLPFAIPGLPQARLSSGANIVSGKAYETIDADMVDMESFALMRAADLYELPFISLRGISDGAEELKHVDGWTQYLHVIDENLAHALDAFEAALAGNSLERR